MSSSSRKLRLGPLPKTATVKITFTCTVVLKAELDRYATMHSQAYGEPVDAVTLIPHMLEVFMERDRAYKQLRQLPDPSGSRSGQDSR